MPKTNHFDFKTISPRRIGDKKALKKQFKGTGKMWNNFIRPGLKIDARNLPAGVAAKTKNPKSTQPRNNILKSLAVGKILSQTDLHGNSLRLKVV